MGGGGTLTVGGFEITQVNYDFTFSTVGMEKTDASDPISDAPAPPSTSVSTFGAIKNARYQYTIVKNTETLSAFRVLTGKMDNLLLSASVGGSQYLNGFRAYTATIPATNDAYCTNQDAPTPDVDVGYLEDATSNIFRNEVVPDAMKTDYEALLAANGWDSEGTVIPQGPASCFDNTFKRASRRETSDVCDANGVQMDEAQDQCVAAIAWLAEAEATDARELMIAACVHDYCSFGTVVTGASDQILHHYQVESFAQRKIDPDLLNPATATAEVAVEEKVTEIKQVASLVMDAELADTILAEVPNQFKIGWAKATGCVENGDGTETCTLTLTVNGIDYFIQGVTVDAVAEALGFRRDRRANVEISIEFTARMPVVIATAVQESGAVVTVATLGAAIGKVIESDPAAFAAAYPAANQAYEEEGSFVFQAITVAATTTLTFAGGSVSPTSAPETHESELDLYLLVVGLVGGVAIIALIVLTVVKCQLSKPVAQRKPQNDESRVEVGLQPSTDTTAGSEPAKGFELTQVPTDQI